MLLFYEFLLDHKPSEAVQNISRATGKDLSRSTAYKWFKKFKDNDFELDDAGRSGRPPQVDNTDLKQLMKKTRGRATRYWHSN
jgi:transposase